MSLDPLTAASFSGDAELYRLVVECLDRVADEGPDALDEVCSAHPERAEELRSAVRVLLDHGLESQVDAPDPLRDLPDLAITGEVGRGGMGVVYEARQVSLDRRVAVKVLMPHLTHDERTIERFRREGRMIGALQHPSIVQVYSVGEADGHNYITMEFVEGSSLDRVLAEARAGGSPLEGRVAVVQIAQVADALDHAHRAGIVHRDVKPSNILIRPDGTPLLTDFGLARRDDLPGLTRSGAQAGTPAYMAPEQTTGSGEVDARSDVFSLGATLYELLTLRRPFDGESSQEIMRNIQLREPLDPRRANPRLSTDLSAVVLKALEKDPARRYQTAAELAEELRAYLEYRPVAARHASWIERTRRWAVRQPLRAALVAVLAIAVPTVSLLVGLRIADQPYVEAALLRARLDEADAAVTRAYLDGLTDKLFDDSKGDLALALERDPDNVEAVAGRAYALLNAEQDPNAAVAFLATRPDLVSEHRALQRIRAWCSAAAGNSDEADAELGRLGEPEEALEAFFAGMRQYGDTSDQHVSTKRQAYGYLQDAVAWAPVPRPAFHYYLAMTAGFERDSKTAVRMAHALRELWPESAYTWRGIGGALQHVDPIASIDAYRRSLEIDSSPPVRNNLANALVAAGRMQEALAEWRRLIEEVPDYPTPHAALGKYVFVTERKPDEALVHLRRAVELDPTRVLPHHYIYMILSGQGRTDEAFAALDVATEHLPGEPVLWRNRANLHADAENYEGAVDALENAVAVAPDDPKNQRAFAELHRDFGFFEKGRRSWERCVELAPNADRAREYERDLGWYLLERSAERAALDPGEAMRIANRQIEETDGASPWPFELLGGALRAQARYDDALAAFDKALELAEPMAHRSARWLEADVEKHIEATKKDRAGADGQ